MGRPPQPAALAPQPTVAVSAPKPTPNLYGPVGMQAMLPPPSVLLTRAVTITCLAAGVCGAGVFAAAAFSAGFVAMGAGGAAVTHAAATQAAVTMYGAMFPATAIAYYSSSRAQPDDEDAVVHPGAGLAAADGFHHHAAEGPEFKSQAEIEEQNGANEARESFREVE